MIGDTIYQVPSVYIFEYVLQYIKYNFLKIFYKIKIIFDKNFVCIQLGFRILV